jgi:photoactive yellow protein
MNRLDPFSNISASQLRTGVERMSEGELDELPFGVIRLDAAGVVTFFSRTEAAQSGYGGRPSIGLEFFSMIAPCMNQPDFMQRIALAKASGKLDVTFQQVGDFDDAERELQVRAISAAEGGIWLFIRRPAS